MIFLVLYVANAALAAIPPSLFLTSKDGKLESLPVGLRRNVERTLQLNADLQLTFFGDAECLRLLDGAAAELFPTLWGPNKGDMCRTAYLLKRGGYYVDLDVQMEVQLTQLAGPKTAFLTVDGGGSRDTAGLNWAVLGAAPGSPVLKATLDRMVVDPPGSDRKLWGPLSLSQGFRDVCGDIEHPSSSKDLDCAGAPTRLYYEENMRDMQMAAIEHPHSFRKASVPILKGALLRKRMTWKGLEYGMFSESEDGTLTKLIAYPRYDDCKQWNCGAEAVPDAANWTARAAAVRTSHATILSQKHVRKGWPAITDEIGRI